MQTMPSDVEGCLLFERNGEQSAPMVYNVAVISMSAASKGSDERELAKEHAKRLASVSFSAYRQLRCLTKTRDEGV